VLVTTGLQGLHTTAAGSQEPAHGDGG